VSLLVIECGYGCMKCDRNVLMEGSTPTSAIEMGIDRGVP